MSRFRTDGIHITSPAGVWGYDDLIGATVRVKSRSIGSGLFSVDSSSEYKVKSIRFRLDIDTGKLVTIIGLDGLDGEYVWKDLELLRLDLCKCSRKKDPTPDKPRKEEDEKKVAVVYNVCNEEGVLVFSEERLQLVGEPAKLTQERPFTEYTYNTETIKETTKKVIVNIKNTFKAGDGYKILDFFGTDIYDAINNNFDGFLGSSYGARFMKGGKNLAILDNGMVDYSDDVFEWEILENPFKKWDIQPRLLIKAKGTEKYLAGRAVGADIRLAVMEPDKNGNVLSLLEIRGGVIKQTSPSKIPDPN